MQSVTLQKAVQKGKVNATFLDKNVGSWEINNGNNKAIKKTLANTERQNGGIIGPSIAEIVRVCLRVCSLMPSITC